MGYKNVCINCRVSFSEGTNYKLFNLDKTCPICKEKMYFVNEKFKAPKKSDDKAWKIVSYLLKNGYNFQNPIYKDDESISFKFPKSIDEAREFIIKLNKKSHLPNSNV